MVPSISYLGCKSACEDTIHVLWGCPALRVIWEVDKMSKKLLKYKFTKFANLLEMIFGIKGIIDTNLLAVIF